MNTPGRASIARRLPLSVAGIVVVVTAIMTALAYLEVRRGLVAAASERLDGVTRQLRGLLEQSSRQAYAALSRVAQSDTVQDYLAAPTGPASAIREHLLRSSRSGSTRALELWDARAKPLLNTTPGESAFSAEARAALAARLDANPGGFTGPYRIIGDSVEFASIVAVRRDSVVSGYLVQRRRLSSNPQSIEAIAELIGTDARMLVGNAAGDVWTDFTRAVANVPLSGATGTEVVRYTRPGGDRVVARVAPIAAADWVVALEFLEAPILAPARRFLYRATMMALLLSVAGAVLGVFVSRAITAPLQEVSRAATALAAGTDSTRVNGSRRDELGQLARSFNAMAEQIELGRARLAAAVDRYRLLFERNPMPMWVFDRETLNFLDVNEAAVRQYGYTREEFLGMSLRDIRPEDEVPQLIAAMSEPGNGRSRLAHWKHRRKDGSLIDVEITRTDIELEGRPASFALANDVTARLEAERLVAASRERIELQLGRLRALRAIDEAILGTTDLRLLLKSVLQEVMGQLHSDAAAILLFNPHSMTIDTASSVGFRTSAAERERVPLGDGVAGRAARERRTIVVTNLAELEISDGLRQTVNREELRAVCAVPLIAKGQLIGVLDVLFRRPFTPGDDWLAFCEALAGQAAMAIESCRSFEDLQRTNLELSLAYDRTIEGWSRALDLRDKETEGHTQRVTEKTVQLARLAAVPDSALIHVRRGALLHDIGKMGVPDGILLKPGPLSQSEWQVMRLHPVFAVKLLSPIEYLRPALDIPYCHHEKWDGTGYPRGLKGEQIPLVARLFSVVDVWDALRSDRPYRKGWSEERVREYLSHEAGTGLDPAAVAMFLELLEREDDDARGFADASARPSAL